MLGVLIITGEYRHKTVTPTFLAEPRRGRVVMAKLGTAFGGGVVLGVLTMVTGLVIGFVLVAVKVHSCVTVLSRLSIRSVQQGMSQAMCRAQHGIYFVATTHDLWHDWSRIAPGVILGTGLFAIYGLGLGALLKNQVVAIVVGLGFTLVVETIIAAIWPTIGEYLPGQAATALEDADRTSFSAARPGSCRGGAGASCSWSTASSSPSSAPSPPCAPTSPDPNHHSRPRPIRPVPGARSPPTASGSHQGRAASP